jgi:hypothetical protein
MDVVLKKADMLRYNNADHIAFHGSSQHISVKYSHVINAPDLISAHGAAVDQETAVFNWVRRNEYTGKKADSDHRRDGTLTGLTVQVRANLRHFDPTVRDAATHVYNMLENYGDVEHRDYDAETMIIDGIIAQLRTPAYAAAVNLLGIAPWIDRLELDNSEFKTYAEDSVGVKLEKPAVGSKAARRTSDETLRAVTARVTSLINLNGPDQYADFAAEYNELVTHYNTLVNEHYGRLHAKTDIAPAIIAPIAEQRFTGKPVIVIPEVFMRRPLRDGTEETVELVFSEDFTVSYRNNISPGTATILIRGSGKYGGEAVTTFNIS